MIEVSVVSHQGSPARGASARFGADGGTIGRANTNKLVLDDPDRTVSRVHAQVVCRDGAWLIVDRGSNPTQLNGQPIGAGNEAAIRPGDRLQLGSYELLVSEAHGATPAAGRAAGESPAVADDDDPFAHLLDGLVDPAAPAPAPPAPAPDPTAGLFPDPLGAAPAPSAPPGDPFADLLPPSGAPAPAAGPDDLSDLGPPASSAQSIDALFGLGDASGPDPLADPLQQPNTASGQDPLAALSNDAAPLPDARSDHVPVGSFGFTPPTARTDPQPPAAQPPREPAEPAPPAPSADDPFAGLDLGVPAAAPSPAGALPAGEPAAAPLPPADDTDALFAGLAADSPAPAAGPDAAEPQASAPAPEPADAVQAPATARPSPVPVAAPVAPPTPLASAQPAALPPTGDAAALLAAFLQGLGPTHKPLDALTPELMQRVGELLRTSTEGTLQLLHTRQEFKQEVRAQVTMIAAQANNPLKFSPTVEVALAHLLGEGVRGFMPAEAAMRDAYQDLRAHEFGVMVGMRAALEHVIRQFEPEALEENIATKSRLDAIFSANRKARLWDQFVKLYAEIAREAEDDFHSLFGKAFLKAYEEQMQRLKAAEQQGGSNAD